MTPMSYALTAPTGDMSTTGSSYFHFRLQSPEQTAHNDHVNVRSIKMKDASLNEVNYSTHHLIFYLQINPPDNRNDRSGVINGRCLKDNLKRKRPSSWQRNRVNLWADDQTWIWIRRTVDGDG